MLDDDRPVGRLLSRREALALFGAAGVLAASRSVSAHEALRRSLLGAAAKLPAAGAAACVVRPEQTEGPYFVDELLNRSDLRTDPANGAISAGTPLKLQFNVGNLANATCGVLAGAWVDVWHCDAAGTYSDVGSAVGHKFLRGYQVTDAGGVARFTTVYPGWYPGRTVHLHFKIRSAPNVTPGYEFTSQLFFDDTLTDQVYTQAPYSSRGTRSTRNAQDGIYAGGGSQLLVAPVADGLGGYDAAFDIALQDVVSVRPSAWSNVKGFFR